ncbi:MAG: hypothetical protein HYX61_01120 [Gammaproteobacteria bacterium]|jgi:hypothetical protein|nr:hypothetical protein [Gammaproteobacteria bacterium]
MRDITNLELNMISGGLISKGYDFSYIVENALAGLFIGVLFPGIAPALGLTTYIANPALATSALFSAFSVARVGANLIDQALYSESVAISAPV